MPSVTVPGTGGSTITLTYDQSASAALAAQIGAALQAAITQGNVRVAGNASGPPPPTNGETGLFLQTLAGVTMLPHGYADVIDAAPNAVVFGSGDLNEAVLSGLGNLTFYATGGSGTVAAGGGNNLISIPVSDTGNWLIQTGSGADTISDRGTGSDTIAAGPGDNAISLGGGQYHVTSVGQDTITGGTGTATIDATGAPATVTELVFGGTGKLQFLGGAGGATLFGGAGSLTVTGGSGTIDATGGAAGNNRLTAGTAAATLFGGGNGDSLTANAPAPQALFAGPGNETLTGGSATGADTFSGGSGKDQITGGLGADTYFGGTGQSTVNALGSSNVFAFVHGASGGSMVVNDLTTASQVSIDLIGYGPNEASNAIANQAAGANAVSITLSDNTMITFRNITHLDASNIS